MGEPAGGRFEQPGLGALGAQQQPPPPPPPPVAVPGRGGGGGRLGPRDGADALRLSCRRSPQQHRPPCRTPTKGTPTASTTIIRATAGPAREAAEAVEEGAEPEARGRSRRRGGGAGGAGAEPEARGRGRGPERRRDGGGAGGGGRGLGKDVSAQYAAASPAWAAARQRSHPRRAPAPPARPWADPRNRRSGRWGLRRNHCPPRLGERPPRAPPEEGMRNSVLPQAAPRFPLRAHKLCPALCDLVYCSPPGSSVHGIIQARIPAWVAIHFSRRSSSPRDQMHIFCISCIASGFFTVSATREPLNFYVTNIF
ncbi:AT-rich interactive domain-containing protein 1B-like [Moschus berezovskii]|uniref:AT-rich interactive domain-containing protein 1B-like n=1 Tax=Moschus berezovskii TaxID=68408 RepID=UPI0024442688|nr:AT-rich interactive domain-containing protein 1B-like [Moschus berezovskii]